MTEKRFSQLYLERGQPSSDSQRARRRIASALMSLSDLSEVSARISRDLGVKGPINSSHEHQWQHWMKEADLRDVLDLPSVAVAVQKAAMIRSAYSSALIRATCDAFIVEVERIFRQENLSYKIDNDGVVHYFQDQEFDESNSSVIAGLAKASHAAARGAFEEAAAALRGATPDTLTAVRRAFDAVENIFKMMFSEPRLGTSEINKRLKPLLSTKYEGRTVDAAKLMASAMSEWVNACHNYRHAPGEPDPSPPPIEVAVALVSTAASHIRWLLTLEG